MVRVASVLPSGMVTRRTQVTLPLHAGAEAGKVFTSYFDPPKAMPFLPLADQVSNTSVLLFHVPLTHCFTTTCAGFA